MAAIPRNMRVYRSTYSLDQVIDTVTCTLGLERSEVAIALPATSACTGPCADHVVRHGNGEWRRLPEVARRLQRDPSTLFVAVERYRTLRPELFNLTALQDSGPLLRQLPLSGEPVADAKQEGRLWAARNCLEPQVCPARSSGLQ